MEAIFGIFATLPGDAQGVSGVSDRGIVEIYLGGTRVAVITSTGERKISIDKEHPMYDIVIKKLDELSWYVDSFNVQNMNAEIEKIRKELTFLTKGLDVGPIKVEVKNDANIDINDFVDNIVVPYMRARYNVMKKYVSKMTERFVKKIDEEINKKIAEIVINVSALIEHGVKIIEKGGKYYYYYPEIIPKYVMKNGLLYELKNDDKKYYIKGLYVPISGKMYTANNIRVDDAHHINVSSNLVCVGQMNGEDITPENVLKLIDMLYIMNEDSPYFHIPKSDIGKKVSRGIRL